MINEICISVWLIGNLMLTNGQQSTSEKITDLPSEDFIDRGQDGSYRFGYKNIDKGGHYHSSSASADNTVSGRFGYRDPSSKKIVQTTYTAGDRGFRARGPNIARKMSLSQSKLPFNPPISPNSADYQPTYDSYFDPNEDPSYEFGFKTRTYSRGEKSDSKGDVTGAYSYIDDVGKRHDVEYEAGSKIGFNVKSPIPDSDPFPGIFYRGPNKPGTPARGHSAIVRKNDGTYSFTASGPDQRRIEISDSSGHVRGSYTYIDNVGVQRTVQYVAGPNIGFKVIKKGASPIYSSVFPFVRPEFLTPSLSDDNIPDLDNPPSTTTELSVLDFNNFGDFKDIFDNDSSSKGNFESKKLGDDLFARDTPTSDHDHSKTTSESNEGQKYDHNLLPPGSSAYLPPYPEEKPQHHTDSPRTENSRTTFSDKTTPNYKDNSIYDTTDFNKPQGTKSESHYHGDDDDDNNKHNEFDGYRYPRPVKKQFSDDGNYRQDDSRYDQSEKNYIKISSSGTPVKAHVQSVDVLPYGSKVPSPGEAIRHHQYKQNF